MLINALHCGYAPARRGLEPASRAIAAAVATAVCIDWRMRTAARIFNHFGPAPHAAVACGERILITGNCRQGQSGGGCRELRCGVSGTLAKYCSLGSRAVAGVVL